MNHFYESIPGWFWFKIAYDEILARLPSDTPSIVVEIGSYMGKSAAYLGVEIVNRNLPVTLHCIDNFSGPNPTTHPWPLEKSLHLRQEFEKNLQPLLDVLKERLVIHPVSSVEATQDFADGSCAVVWIDGDHSYEGCKSDIEVWWPKVQYGGVLGGDDLSWKGVKAAVGESGPYRIIKGITVEGNFSANPAPSWWRDK